MASTMALTIRLPTQVARTVCNNNSSLTGLISIRTKFLSSKQWREKHNRFRTRLDEMRDFSFTDGRGFGPVSVAQKNRYLRDQELAENVVRRYQELETAKKMFPKN